MATLTLHPSANIGIGQAIDLLETAFIDTFPSSAQSNFVVLTGDDYAFWATGNNITYSGFGRDASLATGTLTGIEILELGSSTFPITIANTDLDVSALVSALDAEGLGTDTGALEAIFAGLGYTFTGTSGADVLLSTDTSADGAPMNLAGNDVINLGSGNDDFFLGDGNDQGRGQAGDDTLYGGAGNDYLSGFIGNDDLYGSNGNDALHGHHGRDFLTGGAGDDRMFGGNDGDTLSGGLGRDRMTGGAGSDMFSFEVVSEMGNGYLRDRIMDFELADKINITNLNLTFNAGTQFSGEAPEVIFTLFGSDGLLQIDQDGNGTADGSLLLVGVQTFSADSLFL